MRLLAVVLGLLYGLVAFFLLALVWFSLRESAARQRVPLAAVPLAQVAPPSPVDSGPDRTEPLPLPARETASEPEPPPESAAAPSAAPALSALQGGWIELAGTVIAVDEAGDQHWSESGSFDLEHRQGEHFATLSVPVREGRFDTRVPAHLEMKVRGVELGGRRALSRIERLDWNPSLEVLLVARWPRLSLLRVLAADTREELGAIEVASRATAPGTWIHPGEVDAAAVERTSSPLPLPELLGRRVYWVRAPGYAWGRIEIDHDEGGERALELAPACELVVSIANLPPESGAALRLYGGPAGAARAGGGGPAPVLEIEPVLASPVEIRDLPAGDYEVRLETGAWWRDPELLGGAEVALAPRESTLVELALEDPSPAAEPLEVGGLLALPEGFREQPVVLVIARLESGLPRKQAQARIPAAEMTPSPENSAELRWTAGKLAPGTYLAEVQPLGVLQIFGVAEQPAEPVRIEVPPPAQLLLRALDAETGEPVKSAAAQWHLAPPAGLAAWERRTARADPEGSAIRIVAPRGRLVFSVQASGYASEDGQVALERESEEREVRLSRLCAIRVRLAEGETALPCSTLVRIQAREVNGEGTVRSWGVEGSACLLGVSKAGLYEVSVSGLAGYANPAPMTARTAPGEIGEVVFQLQRVP